MMDDDDDDVSVMDAFESIVADGREDSFCLKVMESGECCWGGSKPGKSANMKRDFKRALNRLLQG